jgi:hypothetical protein
VYGQETFHYRERAGRGWAARVVLKLVGLEIWKSVCYKTFVGVGKYLTTDGISE